MGRSWALLRRLELELCHPQLRHWQSVIVITAGSPRATVQLLLRCRSPGVSPSGLCAPPVAPLSQSASQGAEQELDPPSALSACINKSSLPSPDSDRSQPSSQKLHIHHLVPEPSMPSGSALCFSSIKGRKALPQSDRASPWPRLEFPGLQQGWSSL